MIELSKKAKEDLKMVLIKDAGSDVVNKLTDEQINRFGVLCLTAIKEGLKIKVQEEDSEEV